VLKKVQSPECNAVGVSTLKFHHIASSLGVLQPQDMLSRKAHTAESYFSVCGRARYQRTKSVVWKRWCILKNKTKRNETLTRSSGVGGGHLSLLKLLSPLFFSFWFL